MGKGQRGLLFFAEGSSSPRELWLDPELDDGPLHDNEHPRKDQGGSGAVLTKSDGLRCFILTMLCIIRNVN